MKALALTVLLACAACSKPSAEKPAPPPSAAPVPKEVAIPTASASASAAPPAVTVDPDPTIPYTPDVIVYIGEESEWTLATLTRTGGIVHLRFLLEYKGKNMKAVLDGKAPRVVADGKTYYAKDNKLASASFARGNTLPFEVDFEVPDGVPAKLELAGIDEPTTIRRVAIP
jgi:hypothetical protein